MFSPAAQPQKSAHHGHLQTRLAYVPPVRGAGLRRRLTIYAVLAPLLLLMTLWIWFFLAEGAFRGGPNGASFEADFAMFDTAAIVQHHGSNPYDRAVLYQAERQLLAASRLPIDASPGVVRVGNPPLLFWLMQPLSKLPFQVAAWLWGALLYALAAVGIFALLRHLGWRRKAVAATIFLAMPQIVLGAFYGNTVPIVFAGVAIALAVADRHPALAGSLLTVCWLKPPVALPIAGLILLFHLRHRGRAAIGFLATTLALLALVFATTGAASLGAWVTALIGYSHDVSLSPAIASLTGLYTRHVSGDVRAVLEILKLAAALATTALTWYRMRGRRASYVAVGWLWVVWYLAAPYAHYYDEILLAVPFCALLGRDGWNVTRPSSVVCLYLSFLSLIMLQQTVVSTQVLSIFLLPLLAVLAMTSRRSLRPAVISGSASPAIERLSAG